MSAQFHTVKQYLLDLDLNIVEENQSEEMVVVEDAENGISNLVIDCEAPILVLEQLIMPVPEEPGDLFRKLLLMSGDLIHGAYILTEDEKFVVWRDTLQLENLDSNELEGSVRALSLAMAEHCGQLLKYAKSE